MFIRPKHTEFYVDDDGKRQRTTVVPASIAVENRQYEVVDGVAEIDDADWPFVEHTGWQQCDPPQRAATKPAAAAKPAGKAARTSAPIPENVPDIDPTSVAVDPNAPADIPQGDE